MGSNPLEVTVSHWKCAGRGAQPYGHNPSWSRIGIGMPRASATSTAVS